MQVQLDIPFDQLLKIVKTLPTKQLEQLKAELEEKETTTQDSEFENFLLNGPVATKKQLKIFAQNRKSINQWRTK